MRTDNNRIKCLAEVILRRIREEESNVWSVYMLINHTKKEIYFGVSKDVADRIGQHADKDTKTLKHWAFTKDSIETQVIQTGLTQEIASAKAHRYESQLSAGTKGYKVIQTSGI